jgi:DNA-binding NarL/FixJ family response regulator
MNQSQSALIIDQEGKWVNSLTSLLKEIEIHDIHSVNNRIETLEALKHTRFDLVLINVKSPTKEGVDLINEIQQTDPWTRIIVLSDISNRQVVLSCIYAGALQYILKSDDIRTIRNKIMSVIEGTKSRRESTLKPPRTQFNSFLGE